MHYHQTVAIEKIASNPVEFERALQLVVAELCFVTGMNTHIGYEGVHNRGDVLFWIVAHIHNLSTEGDGHSPVIARGLGLFKT